MNKTIKIDKSLLGIGMGANHTTEEETPWEKHINAAVEYLMATKPHKRYYHPSPLPTPVKDAEDIWTPFRKEREQHS